MEWKPLRSLEFAWWNTSLSPPVASSKASAEDLAFVAGYISELRRDRMFTILGLCEVQASDLAVIMDMMGDSNLSLLDFTDRSEPTKFDTALIYDRDALTYLGSKSFNERHGKRSMKLGVLANFATNIGTHLVSVVLSHWPSRRTVSELEARKLELGSRLRNALEPLRSGQSNPYIVLMGDYNDDPFSPSLQGHLLATRDRDLARKRPEFLYNPFWRCLGESRTTSTGDDPSVCGTHYYANGDESEWFTYDQMMFSSAFLGDGALAQRGTNFDTRVR